MRRQSPESVTQWLFQGLAANEIKAACAIPSKPHFAPSDDRAAENAFVSRMGSNLVGD